MLPALLALFIAFCAVGARHMLQGGPAASPAISRSYCYLPSGYLIDAPDSSISSEYYYDNVNTYSYSSYAVNYYAYYQYSGVTATPAAAPTTAAPVAAPTAALTAAPTAATPAPAPTQVAPTAAAPAPAAPQYPVCCPTQTVQQGDTVTSLLTAASQPTGPGNSAAALFYALNPDVIPDQPLQPGTTITVPCFRILEYFRDTVSPSPVPAPAPAEAEPSQ